MIHFGPTLHEITPSSFIIWFSQGIERKKKSKIASYIASEHICITYMQIIDDLEIILRTQKTIIYIIRT